ncbi:ferritin-like domain-domain-containing protein [Clohesyomyces aquaticus]|uniref:Ferritin-like domain-domain-containing protein n=1 Tax=Clohesyomyces aquaticus TaxID=1231657 RepID=A0A1Y2A5G9_9PLEO|nr:ferritin-like domain-domain-containing protein [Clohesyomyces aquaticus]
MFSKTVYASALLSALAAAAPAPQVPGYSNGDASGLSTPPTGAPATVFGPDSQVPEKAIATSAPTLPPRRSSILDGPTSHGPFSGTPTTTGAVTANTTLAQMIAPLPPNPTATYYNAQGVLLNPAPAPYTPNGGLGTNGTEPRYLVNSDFDFESIALGLYQEWIELDLFNNGLAIFSDDDFLEAGLTAEDRSYIAFMAVQESGHATLLSNMLGEAAPPQCTYDYPFRTVREFIDFNQKLTRWGESGVWGFINHLDSREVGQLLSQSIATEARQQMSFRQMLGLHPMPVWFETGIPQSWAWTYLAPYISSCPENTTRLAWQNFPVLHVVNQPNPNRFSPNDTKPNEVVGNRVADPSDSLIPADESCVNLNVTGYACGPAIAHNRSEPLSFPGKQVNFTWDAPGQAVGPNNSYVTSTSAGTPAFVAWVSQLNLTYTPLTITGNNSGFTYQPASVVYQGDPAANDTMFVALTDADIFLTPFNLSMINPHVAALGLYQAG